jgi:hypothetical protein
MIGTMKYRTPEERIHTRVRVRACATFTARRRYCLSRRRRTLARE